MDNFENLSMKAYKNEILDDEYDFIDKYFFEQLKKLYLDYRCGKINKDKAEIKKKKIKNEYFSEKEYRRKYLEICKEYNSNRINIEYDLSRIEKSNDKEEMLKIALNIIAKMTKDENFLQRNLNKLTF